ncbi:protein Jumonji [Cydia fagiglandana]|uniref:protein Jumonji n=1 Tax=Cydia fagiglandana TaxID=1458189 RepID=UPI002FEE4153
MVEVVAATIYAPSPVLSVALSTNGVEDWCVPPAIKKDPHSPISPSDFSSDIIRLGPPPEPTATPEVQDPQSETDIHPERKIIHVKNDRELGEIRRISSEKLEMNSKNPSEELNVSDNEVTGIEVQAKKNQIKNKAKKDEKGEQNHERDKEAKKAGQKDERGKEDKKVEQKNERDKIDKKAGEKTEKEKEDISKLDDKTKRIKGKGVGKKTVQKETRGRKPKAAPVKEKKTLPKRATNAAPPQGDVATNTRLLRNSREPPPANPDVYEFDELEASRPPSGLRRRNQATPEPPAQSPESIQYMDICPTSSQLVKINTKKEEVGNVLSVSLVPKDDIYKKQKNLIDNLTNSPALLNKFFNCLPTELQNELGSLATEGNGREEAYLEEKARTVLEAPTYYPTAEEFEDPIKYYDKIAPEASKYGLCKIVPPENFKPKCTMSDTIRFAVIYQYISKMYSRWGPVSRELAAIKAHLRTQSVVFARSPLLDGSEVNLPKLYHAVERNGGLSNVIQRKRWGRVADEMKLTKLQHPERKLDPIYMRYLLPYATLSDQERQNIMAEVEKCWTTKYQKMLERARNPFQRQYRMLGTECESESDDEGEDGNTAGALHEAEDCIVQGRTMNLVTFKKIATSLMDAHFEPSKQPPGAVDVEKAYWRAVLLGTEHIVANTASIDTGEEGYGFPKDPQAEYGAHPWNLKVLAKNPNNVLRYLGPVLGVTVPTLHLGMLFSTSCWHRDPHGLPWTEYMHSGAEKIWYGIPRDESANFRRAVETLCPAYCQNKSIWLASEITMVPPNILSEHGVKLSRLLQRPGEYVLVFPEAHSCSITTGFGISESVYFASNAWLTDVYKLFQELRNSCEPTMFSLEQLLLNGSADFSAPYQVCSVLTTLLNAELEHRRALEQKGLKVTRSCSPYSSSRLLGPLPGVLRADHAAQRRAGAPARPRAEGAQDGSSAPYQVCSVLTTLLNAELEHRRALEQKGLKVQERPQSSAPLNTSYFRAWNTRDQDECEYCRSTLFLSKVTGLTGRKSAVCPEHALRLLETKKHKNVELHALEFLSSFTTHALEEMLERLESRTAGEQS